MNLSLILLLVALDPVLFGPGGRFQLERSADTFGLRSHGIIEKVGPNRTKFYPLPQSSPADYRRLRPSEDRASRPYERLEVIGPYQIENAKIWFGKNYYDSEGSSGVGAFGYFDTATRHYTLFSPRAVAPYEISAILVQPEWVWLGLDRFVEDISKSPGGLVRWNRSTHEVEKYPLEFLVDRIQAEDNRVRLVTHDGYALFRDGALRRFLHGGKPIVRFPSPPTHN